MPDILNEPIDDLSRLIPEAQVDLDKLLMEDVGTKRPVGNDSSVLNRAGQIATLMTSPDEALGAYRQVSSELMDTGSSYTYEQLLSRIKKEQIDSYLPALTEFVTNPLIPDEHKQNAVRSVYDEFDRRYSIRGMIGTKSLVDDVHNETHEQENVRINIASMLNEVLDYQDNVQKSLNEQAANVNPDGIKPITDFIRTFIPFTELNYTGAVLDKMEGGEGHGFQGFLTGDQKQKIMDKFKGLSIDERYAKHAELVNALQSAKDIFFNDNDYQAVEVGRQLMEPGYYTDNDKLLDNFGTLLDVVTTVWDVGLGKAVKGTVGVKGASLLDRINNARLNTVKGQAQPTATAPLLQQTNSSKAIDAHIAAAFDDEAATALYGVSKEDAMADDLLPDMNGGESVKFKANFLSPEAEIKYTLARLGAEGITDTDYIQAAINSASKYKNIRGLTARSNMQQFVNTEEGVKLSQVYGPEQGGWENASAAMHIVKGSLEGLVDPDKITLLKRVGDSYSPIKLEDVGSGSDLLFENNGDYLVKADFNLKFDLNNITEFSPLDVKHNWIDQAGVATGRSGQGSLQSMLLSPQDMLHPTLTGGATVATNKAAYLESQLLEIAKPYAEAFKKLTPDRQELLDRFVKEANFREKWPSAARLKAAGFTDDEIKLTRQWRKYWDMHWLLENRDAVITHRSNGYTHMFKDNASNTEFVVKPVKRGGVGNSVAVVDPTTGGVRFLGRTEIDNLYNSGGEIAKLRNPINIGNESVEYVASANRPGSGLIEIKDTDVILPYREGYYTVKYKNPHFIVKRGKDSRGNFDESLDEVVSTAANAKEADLLIRSLKAQSGEDYFARPDMKKEAIHKDIYWQMANAQGRTAQRLRGKRLSEGVNGITMPSSAHIDSPIDSMITSIRSISHRTAMRPIIENARARALQQYGKFFPSDGMGGKLWPKDSSYIIYRGSGKKSRKELGDAVTTYNYINYLEAGYINSIDDGWKNLLRLGAEWVGDKAVKSKRGGELLTKVEEGLYSASGGQGPATKARGIANTLFIATNPVRQLPIQLNQSWQIMANYSKLLGGPKGVGDRVVPYASLLTVYQLGYQPTDLMLKAARLTRAQSDKMFRDFTRSGMVATIDKNNLVRGALADFADQSIGKSNKAVSFLRRVGFDAGEFGTRALQFSAEYATYLKAGKNVSQKDLEDIVTRSENYLLNMNRSGDMPYNQNALNLFMQFQQVPHKVITQMLFNRILTPKEKARLAAFNLLMYGLPAGWGYSVLSRSNSLPEDNVGTDLIVNGFESVALNGLMSAITGDNPRIDFKGLAPTDVHGLGNVVWVMMTEGIPASLAESPFGSLITGRNPKIANLLHTVAKFSGLEQDNDVNPTTALAVAHDSLNLFSGASNFFKAVMMMNTGQKINTQGAVTVDNVSSLQALWQVAGFPTQQEQMKYWASSQMYEDSKQFDDDVKYIVSQVFREFSRDGLEPQEADNLGKVFSAARQALGEGSSMKVNMAIEKEITKRLKDGDIAWLNNILRFSAWGDLGKAKMAVDAANYKDPKLKETMLNLIEEVNNQGKKEYDVNF